MKKKNYCDENLSIYFVNHGLAFLNSFLNIFNKYNILVLNKYILNM